MVAGKTLGDLARENKIPIWKVRRLFERGLLPEPPRIGRYRVVPTEDIPKVVKALRDAGYLPVADAAC